MTGVGSFGQMTAGSAFSSASVGGAGAGGGGRVAVSGQCPADRRIDGFRCAGRGMDVTECPSGSTCMTDGSGGSFCCWDSSSPVEAPCEDPMIQGGTFVQCSPGDRTQSCPGSCHRCQTLGGDMGLGLCCPQINRPGCENSSPMRNEFEAARRRISGSSGGVDSGLGGTSMGMDSGLGGTSRGMDSGLGVDRGSQGRSGGPQFGAVAPQMGMDFGMTNPGGGVRGGQDTLCPDGFPPLGGCSASSPCRSDLVCLEIRRGIGGCCPRDSGRMGGSGGIPGVPGGMGGSASGSRFPDGPAGVGPRLPMCPDGRPSMDRCSTSSSCGPGTACVPVPGIGGLCCPFGPGGMPGMSGAPGMMPPGSPGPLGMPGMTGMPGRRIPLDMLARRRDLMRRARRMLLARAPRPPFGPVISGRDIRRPMF